jgi:hypothetical protein
MDAPEYNQRRAAAEREIDRQVEALHAKPDYSLLKAAGYFAGLITSAAIYGFATGGEISGLMLPVFITMPAMGLAAGWSGASDDGTHDRDRLRPAAYAAAGLKGIRDPSAGPTILDRVAMIFGRRTATRIADRANADIASGMWGAKPTDVRYMVRGDKINAMASDIHNSGPVTKIRITESGAVMATHSVDGKLQAMAGRPSAAKIDAEGKVVSAAWHDDGIVAQTWRAGMDEALSIDVQMIAGELRMLANEIRYDVGHGPIADALDRLYDRALELSSSGHVEVPLTLDATGTVDVDALGRFLMTATKPDDDRDPESSAPRC